jgi:hypothetical protein
MSENQQPDHDPLEQAINAFRRMAVPDQPPDAEVLARFGTASGAAARPVSIPAASKRRYLMRLLVPSAAAALVVIGGVALVLLNGTASLALADVVEAAAKHHLLRVKVTQVTETGDPLAPRGELTSTEYWDLKVPRTRSESRIPGSDQLGEQVIIDITDYAGGRKLITNSLRKDGTLFIMNAKKMSFLDNLKKLQDRKDTTATKDSLDGNELVKYRLKDGDNTTTLWVDVKTKLPVRMEYEMVNPTPGITRNQFTWTDFEWDPKLSDVKNLDELFSTEPPKGYAVQKVDKTGEWDK